MVAGSKYLAVAASAVVGFLFSLTSALPVTEPAQILSRRDNTTPFRNLIYVQTFTDSSGNNISLLPLVQENTGVTHIELAAIHINSDPGDIHLNDNAVNSSYWDNIFSEVTTVQSDGVKVLFMMGGASDESWGRLCSGANGTINFDFYTPLQQTIAYHKIDGIDLDIEVDTDLSCALALLQQFDADFGADFILAMAPVASALTADGSNLSGFDYSTLDSEATSSTRPNGKLVNWYNCQFYNGFGDASTTVDYQSIITNGFEPNRVVLGVLDSSDDGGSGWYSVSVYENTIKSLKSMYSDYGGAIGFEYFNAGNGDGDANPWQWVQSIGQALQAAATTQTSILTWFIRTGSDATLARNAPYPDLTQTLVDQEGVSWFKAVHALHRSSGDVETAREFVRAHKRT